MEQKDFFQLVGETAIYLSRGEYHGGKLILYYEVQDGFIESSMFFRSEHGRILYKRSSKDLKNLIYRFWEDWQRVPGNREWRCMTYVIEDGKFTVDFKYPDEIDDARPSSARRPGVISDHFGDVEVDYSNPE